MTENNLNKIFNAKTLTLFALPTMIMMLFESLYSIVDGIFVARLVNIDAFSSINIIMPALLFFMGVGTMFGVGGSAIIAKKMGEEKYDEARSDFTIIAIVLLTISLLSIVVCFIFINDILEWLGATAVLMPYAKDYFEIILFGLLVFIGQFLFQSFFVVAGEPKMGLIAVISAGLTNILLDYILIVWFDMGIKGAAWGTVISSAIPNVIGIIFFFNRKRTLRFAAPKYNFKIILQSGINGSSSMVNLVAAGIIAFLFNHAMLRLLGEIGVAAITIIAYAEYIFNSIFLGYCVGIAPVVSFNYGAKNWQRIRVIIKLGIVSVLLLSAVTVSFMILCAPYMVKVFSQDNGVLYDIALSGFMIFALKYVFTGINILIAILFTSFSKGKISTFIAAIRTFGFMMPMILILPSFIGVNGVWVAAPISELITFVLSMILFFQAVKKYNSLSLR